VPSHIFMIYVTPWQFLFNGKNIRYPYYSQKHLIHSLTSLRSCFFWCTWYHQWYMVQGFCANFCVTGMMMFSKCISIPMCISWLDTCIMYAKSIADRYYGYIEWIYEWSALVRKDAAGTYKSLLPGEFFFLLCMSCWSKQFLEAYSSLNLQVFF
jgi:hypothetical protein